MPAVAKIVTLLLVLVCFSWGARGMSQCSQEMGHQSVVKKDYKELQRWVNDGHEPWRMDASAVAAEEILKIQNAPQGQWDVYRARLKIVRKTGRRAVFEYKGGQNLCYEVTVRRFSWLLPLAQKWKWMVWAPTDISCRQCQELQPKSFINSIK